MTHLIDLYFQVRLLPNLNSRRCFWRADKTNWYGGKVGRHRQGSNLLKELQNLDNSYFDYSNIFLIHYIFVKFR